MWANDFVGYVQSQSPLYLYFVVENEPESILVQATGPSLQTYYGIAGNYLPDPSLTIYNLATQAQVASDTGWSSNPANVSALQTAFIEAGSINYTLGSADSAVLMTFPPGPYVAVISSPGGNSGAVLGQISDLVGNGGRIAYAAELTSGSSVLAAGEAVSGYENILVRALGPSLGAGYSTGAAPSNASVVGEQDAVGQPTLLTIGDVTPAVVAGAGTFPLLSGSQEFSELVGYDGVISISCDAAPQGYSMLETALDDPYRQNFAPVSFLTLAGGQFAVGSPIQLTTPVLAYPAPTYSWSKDGVVLANQTGAVLTIPAAQASDSGNYTVTFTNAAGSLTSNTATVTVEGPVSITQEPSSQTANPGDTVAFTVAASGTGTVTYQWIFNGNPISGATGATLTLTDVTASSAGTYSVDVTDNAGTTQSEAATLTVNYSRLINLSVLATAGDASPGVILGFVVGGSGTTGSTPFLARAIGPSLAAFGVTNFLPDPNLTVYNASQVSIGSNDNWGANASAITAADNAVGAFALNDPSSLDAAFTASFASGDYTVALGGPGSGQALAELYDEMPGAGAAVPRLINISASAEVDGATATSLSAGFVISGTGTKQLLIRGVGPALAGFNVANALPAPTLTLYNAQTNAVLDTDAGWGSDAAIAAAAGAVGAFTLPANSPDCALLVTLGPGRYSAVVSGLNDSSGIALVEVYEVH